MVFEYEILIEREENKFLTSLDLIYFEDFSISNLLEKGKEILHRIVEAFKTFVRNLATTVKAFVVKKQMQFRLMQIKRLIKKAPSFQYQKVDVYMDPASGKRRDRQMLEMRNLMTKMRLKKKDPRLYKIMESIHSDVMSAYPRQTVTIAKAVQLLELEVGKFDKELDQSVYNLIHMVDATEEVADDPEIQKIVTTIASDLREDDSKRAKSLLRNMQNVFVKLRNSVSEKILYGKKYISKIIFYNMQTGYPAIVNRKPVRWVDVDGMRVPIYKAWEDVEPNSGTPALTYDVNLDMGVDSPPIIVCYQDFFTLDQEVQDAVILHEIGHIAKGHLIGDRLRDYAKDLKELKKQQKMAQRYMDDNPGRNFWGSHGTSVKDIDNEIWAYLFVEIEADKYAIANGGNGDALDSLLQDADNVADMRTYMR